MLRFIIVVIPLLFPGLTYAETCKPWQDRMTTLNNLQIGQIRVDTEDVFNLSTLKESTLLHRLANKVHIKTRPTVIRQQLLFKTGDPFRVEILQETERNLRKNRYIKSALVEAVELCNQQVNILVKIRDNWTLTPGVSFSRSGGNNRSGVELQENNLLGYGKVLTFAYKTTRERNTRLFYYEDPQLFGTHKRFKFTLQDNTDGKGYDVDLKLPFYQEASKYSWGLQTGQLTEDTPIYQAGEINEKITKKDTRHTVFYGWLGRKKKQFIRRFKVGWTYNKQDYLGSSKNKQFKPFSDTESYPWIEIENKNQKYIKKTNFRTMGKIEDISLGRSLTLGVGLLHKQFGSDDNHLKLSAHFDEGYALNSNSLGFVNLEAITYLGKGFRQGGILKASAELDHFNQRGNDWFLSGSIQVANNLKQTEQLLLGGEYGLRGYPKGYQTGNKAVLFKAEKRFHFNWYPLHLLKFGAVVFTEAGSAWGKGNKAKVLADAGIGFRIVPTRSSSENTIHLDLGFPLLDRKKVDKYQFSIRTTHSF